METKPTEKLPASSHKCDRRGTLVPTPSPSRSLMPSRSVTLARWTLAMSTRPCVSTDRWRFLPLTFLAPSYPRSPPPTPVVLTTGYPLWLRWVEDPSRGEPARACVGPSAPSATSRPNARSGSSGIRSSTVGSRAATVARRSRSLRRRRWRRVFRGGCGSSAVRVLWERACGVLSSSIRRRIRPSGRAFSCVLE
jgi:hypothetical protein